MLSDPIDPSEITAKGHHWVRTDDDRIVEYSVSGSQRLDARVLVSGYFAGPPVPASWTQAYEALNIKVIELSYPGLGLSSLHLGRKVIEWPKTDLEPVLEAEGVQDFWVYGVSYGTPHAMAVAQHFGPERVKAMGLRVPYFGLPLSTELGLPDGQMRILTTDEVLRNTLKVKVYRRVSKTIGWVVLRVFSRPGKLMLMLMKSGMLGSMAKLMAGMKLDYPAEFECLSFAHASLFPPGRDDTTLHMMASDVGLDLPGLDPRKIELSDDRVVVWYAADDADCPPSHGEWLAKHFRAKTRVLDGYGHFGGAYIDQPQFIEELIGRP